MRNCTKIREEFTLKNATLFGGYNLFRNFLEHAKIFTSLNKKISITKAPNATYSFSEVLGFMIEGYALGLERTYHFQAIETDPLITAKNGMPKLPDYTLYPKDLLRANQATIKELKQVNRLLIKNNYSDKHIVLDFDSTVNTVYGNQELAERGYNPNKKGRKSFHPLICSIRRNGYIANYTMRKGSNNCLNDFELFFHETLSFFGKNKKITSCLDSGYDNDNVYNAHETKGVGYVVKLKMFEKTKAFALSGKFKDISLGKDFAQVAEMKLTRKDWATERRVVVLRWKYADEEPQGTFWDELGYTYVAYVTNLAWQPIDIVRFYYARGACENRIKESKQGVGINKYSSKNFTANYAED
jgi:hypothetical protein